MRLAWLIAASICSGEAMAQADALSPIVVELRLDQQALEVLAWRGDDGDIYVDRVTLEAFRLQSANAGERVPLSSVEGLSIVEDAANASITLSCQARCFPLQRLDTEPSHPSAQSGRGGFVNLDFVASAVDGQERMGAAFELALFNEAGFGGSTFVIDGRDHALRLDTAWSIDQPERHMRITLGDALARGGAAGVPFRFGGLQIGSDFSLEPGFVYQPTPTLHGEAATPSTIDLYVDGALRFRQRSQAGPFSIDQTPVVSGAGVAQIVVTDALGREQVFTQSFYSSPDLLRPGLSDYSLSLGAERENYGVSSNDYGRGFVSGLYRRGVTQNLTLEGRVETAENDLVGIALGGSLAAHTFGQIDLGLAVSDGDHSGALMRAGWRYENADFNLGFEARAASLGYEQLGQFHESAPPQFFGALSAGKDFGERGGAAIAYAVREGRDGRDARTLSLEYAAPSLGEIDIRFNLVHLDDGAESYVLAGVGFTTSRGDVSLGARREIDRGRSSSSFAAQRTAEPEGGVSWRARGRVGDAARLDGAVSHVGAAHDATLEVSRTRSMSGMRLQVATGIAWMDGAVLATRPVRQSFALVNVGVPGVTVLRDRRPVGKTDDNGQILLTDLRPYDRNLVSIDLNDMPWDTPIADTEIVVVPRARSGAAATFSGAHANAGEVRVVGSDGAPLPRGSVLIRDDGARFPVGDGARAYVTLVDSSATFTGPNQCILRMTPSDLADRAQLTCEAP